MEITHPGVLHHYADPRFRYAGLRHLAQYLATSRYRRSDRKTPPREPSPPDNQSGDT
jgi:hypothetical protein